MGQMTLESMGLIPYPDADAWDIYHNVDEGVGAQGGCFDGEYFYQAIMHRCMDKDRDDYMWHFFDEVEGVECQEYNEDLNEVIIQKLKLTPEGVWVVATELPIHESKPLRLRHGNDMAYNPYIRYSHNGVIKKGLVAVNFCGTYGKSKYCVAFFDKDDLTVVDPHNIQIDWKEVGYQEENVTSEFLLTDTQMISLAYEPTKDVYVAGVTRRRGIQILDSAFRKVKFFKPFDEAKDYIPQGMGCDDKYIYSLYSAGWDADSTNVIALYDWDGNFIEKIVLSNLPREKEVESISIVENNMYIATNIANTGTEIFKVTDISREVKW